MAKILMSYFSDYGEAMYDAISNVLLKNGNDVFRFNLNSQGFHCDNCGGNSVYKNTHIITDIEAFKPDIVLNFNHSLPTNIEQRLPKNCKICIIDADNPETFWNKKQLNKDKEKYFYLGLQKYSKTMYENFIHLKMTDTNYCFFPPATVVQNKKMKQDKNISFIGSNFYPFSVPEGTDFYTKEALNLYDEFKKDYFFPLEKVKKVIPFEEKRLLFERVRAYYVGQDRLKYMAALTDLGFTFYGVRWWDKIAYYDFDIAKCFDPTPKTTLEDNEWVYNTSKISVNISHPQAKSSFSWRVMDIMASNACLLMEEKPDWLELFGSYLTNDVKNAIIYKDRFDMREKAKYLLSHEDFRKKCVAQLNKAIEENGRWEERFSRLEKFLKVSLLNNSPPQPFYRFIQGADACSISKKSSKTFGQKMKFKQRYKCFIYSFLLMLAQIPVIDIFCKHKKRQKLLNKLIKYWR